MRKTPKREGRGHILKGHINLSTVYSYLKGGQYPPGLSDCDKRAVRKRAKSFCLSEGDLYFIEPTKKNNNEEGDEQPVALRKVLTSEEERRKTVLEAHIDSEGNHYGIEKTSNSVSSRYYWVGISNIVRDIIRNCAVCQATRSNVSTSITPSLSKLFGIKQDTEETNIDSDANTSAVSSTPLPLYKADMEPATYFWEKVELQILGPFSCGRRKLYVAIAVDIFSLWPEVTTLVDKSPSAITHFLINLVCRYGVMKSILLRENDNVKFGDVLIRSDLLSQVGIELSLENFHITETNDVWEEIESSILTLINTQCDTWSQCLELCMLPHRVSRPQRAEYTPAYLVHGREFNLPMELSHQDSNSYVDVHMTADQRAQSIRSLMGVYGGYGNTLRMTDANQRGPGANRTPYVVCVEPGQPCPVVKVASVTVSDEDAEKFKEKEVKTLPKNCVVKTMSVASPRPLEKGQKKLVVVSLVERVQRADPVEETEEEVDDTVVKMEMDNSDVDEGAVSTHALDPDYSTSTPITRRGRDKPAALMTSDRVTRRSGRILSPSLTAKSVESGVSVSSESVEKVCASETHGLGFGMEDLDAYYSALEEYKKNAKYPEGFTTHQKRVLRQISKSYFLLNDTLYYLQGARSKKKVVIKMAAERLALLNKAHISETGVHVCRSKVIDRLDSWNVYWKGLTLDCEAFVRACTSCEHGKERPRPDQQTTSKLDDLVEEDDLEMIVEDMDESDDGLDENYDDIAHYLKSNRFPTRCNKNQRVRLKRRCKFFQLVDNRLYYISKDASVKGLRHVLLTDKEKTDAIKDSHSACHYGKNRTYNLLREKYYWRCMIDDVTAYVKKCSQCEPRCPSSDEELARRRMHMSDRVKWFREQMQNPDLDLTQGFVQSLMKTEVMETEEVHDIPEVAMATISTPNKSNQADQVKISMKSRGAGVVSDSLRLKEDSEKEPTEDDKMKYSNVSVKVDSDAVEPVKSSASHVVMETMNRHDSRPTTNKAVVVETQTSTSSQIPSEYQSAVDKVVLVSETQDVMQPGLVVNPSSAIGSEQGIPVTAGQGVDSTSGSVQMVVVSSDQWNTPDLNILNHRVRIPYQCERVSVEQLPDQEQDQSAILSGVNKAVLSSGNALAELVKATVGDLTGEESTEKSETASAVASIPTADVSQDDRNQMEVDEDEVDEDDEEYIPDDEAEDGTAAARKVNQGTVPKRLARFTCHVCNKDIKGTVKFKMHMYKHDGIKPFSCEICEKKFTNNKSLRIHMRKHTGDTPFLCNLCGKGFSRATSLRYHLKAHEEGGGVPVICDVCGREFTTSNRLEKHKLAKHPAQAPVYQCEECDKVFTAQRSLKRHMVSHQGIRSYQCQICGRGFFRKEYLNSHLAQHPEAYQASRVKVSKPRQKKKQVMVVDPSSGLQVQSMVQVPAGQSQSQNSDSTAFVFPQESVQYEVECLTSESTLTEADLKAIHFLAQASIHGQF